MEEVYIQIPRRIYLEMLGEIEDLKEELEKKDALLSEPDSYDKFLIRKSKYISEVTHFTMNYIVNKEKLKETKESLNTLKVSYNTLNDLYSQKVEEMNTLANNVKEVLRSLSACINSTSPTNRMRKAQGSLAKLYNSLLKSAGV
jgi:hypothetical protein